MNTNRFERNLSSMLVLATILGLAVLVKTPAAFGCGQNSPGGCKSEQTAPDLPTLWDDILLFLRQIGL